MDKNPDGDFEWQYNPRASVPNAQDYFNRAIELSEQARSRYKPVCDIVYGDGVKTTLDIFPAKQADAPVHVFLHGGYWRDLDKSHYSFVANALVPRGITTVVMNYDLCPGVSVPEIVEQVRQGIRWVYAHAGEFTGQGADRAKTPSLTLSGHSAGAHLIAAALAADSGAPVLPAGRFPASVLISGVYELEPVLSISVNEQIRLQPDMVDPMSPMRHPPIAGLPLHITAGGNEPAAWIRQSSDFARACRRNGTRQCTFRVIDGEDHFSIMTLLETPDGALADVIGGLSRTPTNGEA